MAEASESKGLPPDAQIVGRVFRAFWKGLTETIGSAPTSVLLRRAMVNSRDECPALKQITIEKNGRDYQYHIPPEVESDPHACREVGVFVNSVLSLLSELTGSVLVNQLLADPLIRELAGRKEWR